MNRIYIIILLLLCGQPAGAQLFDKVWVQGGGVSYTTTFTQQGPVNAFFSTYYSPYFSYGNSNICDSSGNLLLCSDGFNVYDNVPNLIKNGDTIVPNELFKIENGGTIMSQSSIMLPMQGNKYYLVTPVASDTLVNPGWYDKTSGKGYFDMLLYAVVDMKANGGKGAVTSKKNVLLQSVRLSKTQMMACKHGDGKSWWLLKQASDTNLVYKFLFTDKGVLGPYLQRFSQPMFTGWDNTGQSVFTRDGSRYATTCMGAGKVFLADFDRCTGNLSNPKVYDVPNQWTIQDPNTIDTDRYITGLAFSPSGRFLYVAKRFNIIQMDLWDTRPTTTWHHVAGIDTTYERFMLYYNLYLGPDDKLYVGNMDGLSGEMSVINHPDVGGSGCGFCPRCLRFPTYYYKVNGVTKWQTGVGTPPCMPNYRLGAASPPCWVTEVPAAPEASAPFSVYPNPTSGKFRVQYRVDPGEEGWIAVSDLQGREVLRKQLHPMMMGFMLDLSNQPNGIYLYRFIVNGTTRYSGKIELEQ